MRLTTTLRLLQQANACGERYKHLRHAIGKNWDLDTPINLLRILRTNGFSDCIWALRATAQPESAAIASRLIGADIAELVLPTYECYYLDDNRPRRAINTAREYVQGLANHDQLSHAHQDALSIASTTNNPGAGAAAYAACPYDEHIIASRVLGWAYPIRVKNWPPFESIIRKYLEE
jgi:hypothetical protein